MKVVVAGNVGSAIWLPSNHIPSDNEIGILENQINIGNFKPGGSAYFISNILQQLGYDPYLVSALGDDSYGKACLQDIQKKNLNTELLKIRRDCKTAINIHFINEHGSTSHYHYPGALDGYTVDSLQFSNDIEYAVIAHEGVAPHTELLEKLKSHNKKIVWICKHSTENWPSSVLSEYIRKSTYIIMNYNEELGFMRRLGVTSIHDLIREGTEAVCFLLENKGVNFITQDDSFLFPAVKPKIAAPSFHYCDLFAAGFIHGLLENRTIKECVNYGQLFNICYKKKSNSEIMINSELISQAKNKKTTV